MNPWESNHRDGPTGQKIIPMIALIIYKDNYTDSIPWKAIIGMALWAIINILAMQNPCDWKKKTITDKKVIIGCRQYLTINNNYYTEII